MLWWTNWKLRWGSAKTREQTVREVGSVVPAFDPNAVRLVARALADRDAHVRGAAAEVLGCMIPDASRVVSNTLVESLTKDLNSPSSSAAAAAASALILLRITEPFVEALWNERTRDNAASILLGMIGRRAVPLLEKELSRTHDVPPEVVRLSASVLDFASTRESMVTLVGELGDSAVEGTLLRERHHWDEGVRSAAERALERRRLAKTQQRHTTEGETEGAARLEAVLILFSRDFAPKERFVDSILDKMEVRGRSYRAWMDGRTPVIIDVRASAQEPAVFLATAKIAFQTRLNRRIDVAKTEYATFEGSEAISGVIVTLWNH